MHFCERDAALERGGLARAAAVQRAADDRAFHWMPVEPSDGREIFRDRFAAALPSFANAFVAGELGAVQSRHHEAAIAEGAALAEHAGADLGPRRRNDEALRQRPIRAEVGGRLVLLVDDAHRHDHESRTDVRRGAVQEIEVVLTHEEICRIDWVRCRI